MTVNWLIGDVREKMSELPDGSVHCVVTSPPYFGLRDYGTASWEGGDPACEHVGKRSTGASTLKNDGRPNPGILDDHKVPGVPYKGSCPDCGAVRADKQIGLEETPAAFVEVMVGVFREVRRVLRDDGTLWLNLGDSYAGSGKGGNPEAGKQATNAGSQTIGVLYGTGKTAREAAVTNVTRKTFDGIKAKDLIGIPWMVAFALRNDGWYLRQDIIWSKPNPMPESVTDRCTKAHEYLFLLSKSARYYFDQEAILEDVSPNTHPRMSQNIDAQAGSDRVPGKTNGPMRAVGRSKSAEPGLRIKNNTSMDEALCSYVATARNKRSVWTVTTQPFSEAHFATFPPALIEPCIKAGCPVGGTVLDPFGGAGTTGLVADRLQRNAILIELNPAYAAMGQRRIADDAGPLAELWAAQ